MPPNLRVVDVSPWLKARKSFFWLSGAIPWPVSLTLNRSSQSRSFSVSHGDAHGHFAGFSKFDRVAHQVDEHLSDPAGVAPDPRWDSGLDEAGEFDLFRLGPFGQRLEGSLEHARAD